MNNNKNKSVSTSRVKKDDALLSVNPFAWLYEEPSTATRWKNNYPYKSSAEAIASSWVVIGNALKKAAKDVA